MAEAWVTLATNDSYALGALVLGTSLRRVGTSRQLAALITPGVSPSMRSVLESVFDVVTLVDVLDSGDTANLALLTRPELGITFSKIHAWKLTQFQKCVFLDADTLAIQNCDELFEREEFSAAPDSGWPDCFNSGVFVFRPSNETYASILAFALEQGSFDGGDQGLLNSYFKDWSVSDISRHLPFIYNMVASAVYSYLPAYRIFGQNVKIAHFIGPSKPWLQYFDSATGLVGAPQGQEHLRELLQAWWDIFRADVHPKLSPEMKGLAGAFAQMSLEGSKSSEQLIYEDTMRKHAWEQGHMDYLGKDSFDNILKKLQQSMAQAALGPQPAKEKSPPPAVPEPAPVAAPTAAPASTLQAPPATQPAGAVEAPSVLVTPGTPVATQPPTLVSQAPAPAPAAEPAPVPVSVAPQPTSARAATPPAVAEAPATVPSTGTVPAAESASVQSAPLASPVSVPAEAPVAAAAPAPVAAPAPAEASAPAATPAPAAAAEATPAPALAASAPTSAAAPTPTPPTTPEGPPVEEPLVTQVTAQECSCPLPPKPEVPVAAVEAEVLAATPSAKTAEELEEEVLASQRAALEKKLAEQKRTAEQKLLEERAAAEAAKAKAATGGSAPAAAAAPAPAKEPSAGAAAAGGQKPAEPKAPPRKAPAKGKK